MFLYQSRNKLDSNLLSKVITGEANHAEREEFYESLKEDKQAEETFYEVKSLWLKIGSQYLSSNVDVEFEKLWAQLSIPEKPSFFVNIRRIKQYAAIVLCVLSVGLFAGYFITKNKLSSEGTALQKFTTTKGGITMIELGDGTKVWLNSGTELTYHVDAKTKQRVAELNGEAYFKVKHNQYLPFSVKVDKIVIRDIGTSFNIKGYPKDHNVVTTLIEGEAHVLSAKGGFLMGLTPGQSAIFSKSEKSLKRVALNESVVSAWKEQKFVFQDQTLQEIFQEISGWYNVEFKFQDNRFKNYQYTLCVKKTTSLANMLKMLKLTTKLNYKIIEQAGKPNKVVIY